MIRSMTGFGRSEAGFKKGKITVEIKTVNHKFFDATLKLPPNIITFEDDIKEVLQKAILRGKVHMNLICHGTLSDGGKIMINKAAAKDYYHELLRLEKDLGLADSITIDKIVALPGVVSYEASEERIAKYWPVVKKALDAALARLLKDREKEGQALCRDLAMRSRRILKMLNEIKARAHISIDDYRKRFSQRVKEVTGGGDVNAGRLEMEVAIYAKNCDISEEITRLQNHLSNFDKTIGGNGEVGKKLDFIAQELHREANTIGSKASDFKISKNVIEIKSEIEKIREQAKNLE